MMTDEELKTLAEDTYKGKVFTSEMIPKDQMKDMLPQVFAVMNLMDNKTWEELKAQKPTLFFEYVEKSSMSVNSFPMFMSMCHIGEEEHRKYHDYYKKIKTAIEGIK